MPADSPDILHDVFISYARKDANLGAAPLDAALQPRYRTWRDVNDIDPTNMFMVEIREAIDASRFVLLCLTPDVLRHDSFVLNEIAYAGHIKKPILVLRFANILPPLNVFALTWIDFFAGWDAAFERLCRALDGKDVPSDRTVAPPAADPYAAYVKRVYETAVRDINDSILSANVLALRTVESSADVPQRVQRLEQRFITHSIKKALTPAEPPPETFSSLTAAYASSACDGRVLLLGEPGAGKTTTLLAFARDAAAARLSDPAQPLPVFARIAGWNSLDQTPLHDWLAAMYPNLKAPTFHSLIEQGQALLLLDGLDELGSRRPLDPNDPAKGDYDPRERFLKVLPPSGKVILSSRVEEYRQIGAQAALNCAVRLEPLDDAQMQTYLADIPDLWQVIAADASLKEPLRTPLLLALVRVGFEGSPADVRALRDLSAGDLNDRIWNAFIDQRWAHEQARQPDRPLAYPVSELKQRLGMAVVRAMYGWRDDYTRFLAQDIGGEDAESVITLAERLDLLRPAGDELVHEHNLFRPAEPATSYRFLHLRLRDALAFSAALAALQDPDWNVRSRTTHVLGDLGDARAVEPLITALRDPDTYVRRHAAEALGALGNACAIEPLIATRYDPDNVLRRLAVEALGALGNTRAIEPLIAALQDSEWDVLRSAVNALSKLGEPAVKSLIAALQDPNENVRGRTAWALGQLGDTRAVEPLIAALHDPHEYVRRETASALGQLGDARAVEPLITALQDPHEAIRAIAAAALGELGDARAVEPLIAALQDPDRWIRNNSAGALRKFPDHPAARQALAEYTAGRLKPRGRLSQWIHNLGFKLRLFFRQS